LSAPVLRIRLSRELITFSSFRAIPDKDKQQYYSLDYWIGDNSYFAHMGRMMLSGRMDEVFKIILSNYKHLGEEL
jgi:acyl-coenzyme A synthetase/AMP-(fatty) acid ligase